MSSSTTDRRPHWGLCIALLLATMWMSPAAHAEPTTFKDSYGQGREALQGGAFEQALDRFRQSLVDAGEHQAASWKGMIGVAYAFRGLEQPGYALEYYRRFLDASALHLKMLPPKWRARREAVEAEVGELEHQALETHALVSVTSTPTEAVLFVNDVRVGADGEAKTPYPIYLKPGEHTLRISLEGYTEVIRTVTLSAGELIPMSATLERIGGPPEPIPDPATSAPATSETPGDAVTPVTKSIQVSDAPSMVGPYTMIGVGGALAVAAVGLTVVATLENNALDAHVRQLSENAPGDGYTVQEAKDDVEKAESLSASRDTMQMASNVLYGLSIGVAIGGIIWMAVAESPGDTTDTAEFSIPVIGVTPTRGGAVTSATWRF
ncbi:MAG: PEGA domain-containing protein [Myxococcota bacterium]